MQSPSRISFSCKNSVFVAILAPFKDKTILSQVKYDTKAEIRDIIRANATAIYESSNNHSEIK